MAIKHSIRFGWSASGSGSALSYSLDLEGGREQNIDETIPDASTDLEVSFTQDVSQAQSVFLLASCDMTLDTNNNVTPAATVALLANVPKVWTMHDGASRHPFGATDVTKLFITNASGAAGTLKIRSLDDPTI